MTCSRWIRVCVDTFDHPSLKGEFDRRSAWLWLIANAAWKDHRARTRGGMVDLKRGQVIAGSAHLAEVWGWSRKKVRTFLGQLEAEGMIEKGPAKNQYATIVSICNYDKYQTPAEKEANERASEGPAKGQPEASEGPHSTRDTKDTNIVSFPPVVPPRQPEAPAASQEFKGKFIQLSEDEVDEIVSGYRNLSFPADLIAADRFLAGNVKPMELALLMPDGRASKVHAYLAKRNREAREAEPEAQEKPKSNTMATLERLGAQWAQEASHV